MQVNIEIKHVNSLKLAAGFDDSGNLEHQLTFKAVLMPGDTDRLLHLFRQRSQYGTPVVLLVTSPQARMDLEVKMVKDESLDRGDGLKPFSFDDFEYLVISAEEDGKADSYRCHFGDQDNGGVGDTPKSAVLAALVGNGVIEKFNMKDAESVVDGVASYIVNNFPNSPGKRMVLFTLANDSFEYPADIKEKAKDDGKVKPDKPKKTS